MLPAENAFRTLRESWFSSELRLKSHEREWEDETEEELRERNNAAMKAKFDEDTEAILRGEARPINPRCGADLYGR
jgi:hypothetical protein